MAFMLMWYWTLTGCRHLKKWVTYSLEALRCVFCSACVCSNKFFVCKVSKSPLILHCLCACCLCFCKIEEDWKPPSCCWLIPICLIFECPYFCLCSHEVPLLSQNWSKWKRGLSSSWYQFVVALYWFWRRLVSLGCHALPLLSVRTSVPVWWKEPQN